MTSRFVVYEGLVHLSNSRIIDESITLLLSFRGVTGHPVVGCCSRSA